MTNDDLLNSTAATYDAIFEDYERQSNGVSPEFAAFRSAFAGSASGPLIDLGCGPGRDSVAFRSLGIDVFALDASSAMTRRTAEQGTPVVRGDLRRLPFASASAKALWSSASLLHVPREHTGQTLHEWRRVLTNGGLLGLSTSVGNDEGYEAVPYGPGIEYRSAELHRWFVHRQPDELTELLQAASFRVEHSSQRTSHRTWQHILARAV